MECAAKQAARRARLEAEGRSAEQDSEVSTHRRGRRLWEEVHTMYYSRCAAWAECAAVCIGLLPRMGMNRLDWLLPQRGVNFEVASMSSVYVLVHALCICPLRAGQREQ